MCPWYMCIRKKDYLTICLRLGVFSDCEYPTAYQRVDANVDFQPRVSASQAAEPTYPTLPAPASKV